MENLVYSAIIPEPRRAAKSGSSESDGTESATSHPKIAERKKQLKELKPPRRSAWPTSIYQMNPSVEAPLGSFYRPSKIRSRSNKARTIDDPLQKKVDELNKYLSLLHYTKHVSSTPLRQLPIPKALKRDYLKIYFRRAFRSDNQNLDFNVAFIPPRTITSFVETGGETEDDDVDKPEEIVYFSENEDPIDFLISLGFDGDEAALSLRQPEIKRRLQAALVEARIWVKYLTDMQGMLLFYFCLVVTPKIIRFFPQMVEAIVHNRITSAPQIDSFIITLERVDDDTTRQFRGFDKLGRKYKNQPIFAKKQMVTVFIELKAIANEESHDKRHRDINRVQAYMLKYLSTKYRPKNLHENHAQLLARYIGRGLLYKRAQLDQAIKYIKMREGKEIDIEEFEDFCGIDSKEPAPPTDDEFWEKEWSFMWSGRDMETPLARGKRDAFDEDSLDEMLESEETWGDEELPAWSIRGESEISTEATPPPPPPRPPPPPLPPQQPATPPPSPSLSSLTWTSSTQTPSSSPSQVPTQPMTSRISTSTICDKEMVAFEPDVPEECKVSDRNPTRNLLLTPCPPDCEC